MTTADDTVTIDRATLQRVTEMAEIGGPPERSSASSCSDGKDRPMRACSSE